MTCPRSPTDSSQAPDMPREPDINVAAQLKAVRQKLGLTQPAFAQTFSLSVGTVRDWEQGRVIPDRAAHTLLQVIAHNPDAVKAALQAQGETS